MGYTAIEALQELYDELLQHKDFIITNLAEEKNKFLQTLDKGEEQFYRALEICRREGKHALDAKTVFTLYDTFGFPPEITAELASENGMEIDYEGFEGLYKGHQELSRQGALQKFKGGLADNTLETSALHNKIHKSVYQRKYRSPAGCLYIGLMWYN